MSRNLKDIKNLCLHTLVGIDRSQTYFWTKRWQEGELQAEEDIRSGHVINFYNVADLIADLESDERSSST